MILKTIEELRREIDRLTESRDQLAKRAASYLVELADKEDSVKRLTKQRDSAVQALQELAVTHQSDEIGQQIDMVLDSLAQADAGWQEPE